MGAALRRHARHTGEPKVLFTCTSFLALPGKWAQLHAALTSLAPYVASTPCVHAWVVINEYDADDTTDWAARVNDAFPWVTFAQKGADATGQGATLNLILEHLLRGFDLWLQWEESWHVDAAAAPTPTFLQDAATYMWRVNPDVDQLQMTRAPGASVPDWGDLPVSDLPLATMPGTQQFLQVIASPERHAFARAHTTLAGVAAAPWADMIRTWPLFSLRPSLNRVAFLASLPGGGFSTDPTYRAVVFEWEFARRWMLHGGTKAIFRVAPVTRAASHVSTYHSR
jgi:hypothetical protein